MGQRTSYTPGTFSWTDLTTTDQAGAKAFYGELFGWEAEDHPIADGVHYSMMKLGGQTVAAISPQNEHQRAAKAPPSWNSYVTVQSADDAAARAEELGATIHAPAFDVFDAGRMAAIRDPQGAYFLVWEPRRNPGASLVNAPGALSWNELASTDMDASAAFYGQLFGWTIEPFADSPAPYMTIRNSEGHGNGGIRPVMPPGTMPHWLVYFGVEEVDAAVATVERLGGGRVSETMSIGPGEVAIVTDPQGAALALYAGHFDE